MRKHSLLGSGVRPFCHSPSLHQVIGKKQDTRKGRSRTFYARSKGPFGEAGQMKKCGQRGQLTVSSLGENAPATIPASILSASFCPLLSFAGFRFTGSMISSVRWSASTTKLFPKLAV